MPKSARLTYTIFLGAILALAGICAPPPLAATDFPHFDYMNSEARAEYLVVMVDTTEQAFRHGGQNDFADQVEKLFTGVLGDDASTLGMVELVRNVARARVADAERITKDPSARRIQVEDALFVTLKKNMMAPTKDEMNEVLGKMSTFRAKTYADFEALTAPDQRRTILLYANLGFSTLMLFNEIEDVLKGKKDNSDPDQEKRIALMERQVINDEFLSPGEPGLAVVKQQIADAYAKTPDDFRPGVIYTVLIYVLTEADNRIMAKIHKMEDGTYHLPDSGSNQQSGMQAFVQFLNKLQAASVPQASTAPAKSTPPPAPAAPPPTAAPAASENSAPEDDPIGGGGFITPPTEFITLLCVQPSLVDQSWGSPAPMSKMAYFQGVVGKYVLSIAKPDWQYWVLQPAYDSFDPAANADPAKLVRPVPPDSQPDLGNCPGRYKAYNVQVRH